MPTDLATKPQHTSQSFANHWAKSHTLYTIINFLEAYRIYCSDCKSFQGDHLNFIVI